MQKMTILVHGIFGNLYIKQCKNIKYKLKTYLFWSKNLKCTGRQKNARKYPRQLIREPSAVAKTRKINHLYWAEITWARAHRQKWPINAWRPAHFLMLCSLEDEIRQQHIIRLTNTVLVVSNNYHMSIYLANRMFNEMLIQYWHTPMCMCV